MQRVGDMRLELLGPRAEPVPSDTEWLTLESKSCLLGEDTRFAVLPASIATALGTVPGTWRTLSNEWMQGGESH